MILTFVFFFFLEAVLDNEGKAAIHVAVEAASGEETLAALLGALDQLKELRDNEGRTPLLVAAACGNHEALEQLLRAGAKGEMMDKAGRNAVHLGAMFGELPRLKRELMARLVEVEDGQGNTPMHVAASRSVLEELKALGGDEKKTNKAGETALDRLGRAEKEEEREEGEEREKARAELIAKEKARLEAEEEKRRHSEAIAGKMAEKNAAKTAQKRARQAERMAAAGEREEEGEEEQEEQEREEEEDSEERKERIKKEKRMQKPKKSAEAEAAAIVEPVVIGGRRSVIWMLAIVALFFALFIGLNLQNKRAKK